MTTKHKHNALRLKAQKGKTKQARGWVYYYLTRKWSIYITRILLPTDITPNQITWAAIIISCIALVSALVGLIWFAAILIYGSILLDKVDGEIARLKDKESFHGKKLDDIYHYLTPTIFYFGVGLAAFHTLPHNAILAGLYGSIYLGLRIFKKKGIGVNSKMLDHNPILFHGSKLNDTLPHIMVTTLLWYLSQSLFSLFLAITLINPVIRFLYKSRSALRSQGVLK